VKEGKFSYIGLSEVSSASIIRANKVHPIAAVEIEYSPFSTEAEDNGVLKTCQELGIAVIAYSPLGRGFLTGQIKKIEDIPEKDFRRYLDRFLPENFVHNLELVEQITKIAHAKGCAVAQLTLAWVLAQGSNIIPIPGSTTAARTEENMTTTSKVKITQEDLDKIRGILNQFTVKGGRYSDAQESSLWG